MSYSYGVSQPRDKQYQTEYFLGTELALYDFVKFIVEIFGLEQFCIFSMKNSTLRRVSHLLTE